MHKLILFFIVLLLLTGTARGQEGAEESSGSPVQSRAVESMLLHAGVPETEAARMVQGMAAAGFTREQMTLIVQQVQVAAGEQVTREAVAGKIQEGLAKRIGPEGIVKAAERVSERYGFAMEMARSVLSPPHAGLGGIIADGLASGLEREDGKRVAVALGVRARQTGTDARALSVESMTTLRDIVRLGVSSRLSASLVGGALEKGYDPASMQILRQTISDQRMQGNMDQVARGLVAAIEKGVRAKDLGAQAGNSNGKGSGGSGAGSGSGSSGGGGSGAGGGAGSSGGGGSGAGGGAGSSGSGHGGAGASGGGHGGAGSGGGKGGGR